MANIMREVASLLGVKLGEKFKIKGYGGGWYLIGDGLWNDKDTDEHLDMLMALLNGEKEIIKQQWRPVCGEQYYNWYGVMIDELSLSCDEWLNHTTDIEKLTMGNCFRTKEEAIANKDKVFAAYKAILKSPQEEE